MTIINKTMKNINMAILALAFPLLSVAQSHATAEDVHEIIDICTSSERIMKDYALLGMRVTYHNPKKDLDETVKHLDEEMEMLEKHHLAESLHEEEVALHKLWAEIEHNLTQTPNKANALELKHKVDAFAQKCEEVAEDLAKDTGNKAEHDVVLIARLNLDVQKLAGAYVMKAWDAIGDDEYYKGVKEIKEDYQKTFEELESADDSLVSKKVKQHLKIVDKHFMMFEFMAESRSGRFVPQLIAKKANKINDETEKILKEEEQEKEK
ncbi:MAG: hypothetical protein GXO30_02210 [Epsilonproteobacteria bacterium]|nr:hypothetical protein [Campylobacterota bacterium]